MCNIFALYITTIQPHFLHTDFNHWRDEDESDAGDEEPELDSV
jgi:hypothetical protein